MTKVTTLNGTCFQSRGEEAFKTLKLLPIDYKILQMLVKFVIMLVL